MSEGLLNLVWVVWGDLALLYKSLILLRFPDNTGMPFVLAMEVGNSRNTQVSCGLDLVLAHLSVSSPSVGQSKSHVQDQIQEVRKQICLLNERKCKVTGQRHKYKEA